MYCVCIIMLSTALRITTVQNFARNINKTATFFYAAWFATKINRCFHVNEYGDLSVVFPVFKL